MSLSLPARPGRRKDPYREELPYLAGSIIGFREWRSDLWLSRLDPLITGRAWAKDGRPTCAVCVRGVAWPPHTAPGPDCDCGLYAQHPWNTTVDLGYRWFDPRSVFGFVEAWGRIEVHAQGFRAEYARPVAFIRFPPDDRQDQDERRRYDERLARLAGECGAELIGSGQELSVEDWLEANPRQLTKEAVIRLVPGVRKHLPPGRFRLALRSLRASAWEAVRLAGNILLGIWAIAFMLFIFWPILLVILHVTFGWDPLNWNEGSGR